MPDADGDVIVVGSGPAGVSAAFPLVDAGARVLVVDGGEESNTTLPSDAYLPARRHDRSQADWMIGSTGHALRVRASASPKLRVPTLDYAFRGFARENRIEAKDFTLIGSLAVGGLSNVWGCGVARFDRRDWMPLDVDETEWDRSFSVIAHRIGVSGRADDDLSPFFGLDSLAQAPIALDPLHERLRQGYEAQRTSLNADGFRLGRARIAVLTEASRHGRQVCDRRGLCLWGCPREAMYSARHDVAALSRHSNFVHRPGSYVERLVRESAGWRVELRRRDGARDSLGARRVVLAAGTLASTAIAMRSLPGFSSARLLHVPTAAFALVQPRFLGRPAEGGVGFAQLAFSLDGETGAEVCGYTFSTQGLPVSEFVRHAPLSRAGAASVFRELLPATIVVNCFLPSRLSRSRVELRADGVLRVHGGEASETAEYARQVRRRLARAFRRAGAFMLPGSFSRGTVGSDVHYAATMPMRRSPSLGECGIDGQLAGLDGVYVVDGAALPSLPAKSHTMAIMANAHRVAVGLAHALA